MECNINKIGYFFIALIWNIAVLSVVSFLLGWAFDILGSFFDSEIIRGYAYGVALLATISMFWFGLLAAILSNFVKCKQCDSRIMTLSAPFFVSLTKCKCNNCNKVMLKHS